MEWGVGLQREAHREAIDAYTYPIPVPRKCFFAVASPSFSSKAKRMACFLPREMSPNIYLSAPDLDPVEQARQQRTLRRMRYNGADISKGVACKARKW